MHPHVRTHLPDFHTPEVTELAKEVLACHSKTITESSSVLDVLWPAVEAAPLISRVPRPRCRSGILDISRESRAETARRMAARSSPPRPSAFCNCLPFTRPSSGTIRGLLRSRSRPPAFRLCSLLLADKWGPTAAAAPADIAALARTVAAVGLEFGLFAGDYPSAIEIGNEPGLFAARRRRGVVR